MFWVHSELCCIAYICVIWHLDSPTSKSALPPKVKGSSPAAWEGCCSLLPWVSSQEGPARHGRRRTPQTLSLLPLSFLGVRLVPTSALCVELLWPHEDVVSWICGFLLLGVGIVTFAAIFHVVGILIWNWYRIFLLDINTTILRNKMCCKNHWAVSVWPLFSTHTWSEAQSKCRKWVKGKLKMLMPPFYIRGKQKVKGMFLMTVGYCAFEWLALG